MKKVLIITLKFKEKIKELKERILAMMGPAPNFSDEERDMAAHEASEGSFPDTRLYSPGPTRLSTTTHGSTQTL